MSSVNYKNFPKVTINFPVDDFVKYAKISYKGSTTATNYTVNLPGKYYGTYTGGGDLSFNTIYTFTITPYNSSDISGNKQTIAIDTTPKVTGIIATNSTASNTQLQWKWCGNSPFSYVNIQRQITAPYTTGYEDVSKNIISSEPYYDIDLSGNTTYIYKITPYTAGDISYSDISNVLTYTSNAQAARDLSVIFYDTSSIMISFTAKNSYSSTSTIYYKLDVSNQNISPIITGVTGTSSPLLIQNLINNRKYDCKIITYLNDVLNTTSSKITAVTNSLYPPPTDSMIYYYKFDVGDINNNLLANYSTGSAVYDTSVNAGSIVTADSKVDACYLSSSTPSTGTTYLSLPSFSLGTSFPGFSVTTWFKTASSVPLNQFDCIFCFMRQQANYASRSIWFEFGDNAANGLALKINDTSYRYAYTLTANTWYHFGITISSNYTYNLYINNSNVKTFMNVVQPVLYYTVNQINCSNGGGNSASLGSIRYDDFRVYSKGLSASDISNIYYYQSPKY